MANVEKRMHDKEALQIEIHGIVQGVGFRPFIFSAAKEYEITGHIKNTSFGVLLHIEGSFCNLDNFIKTIKKTPPVLSQITKIISKKIPTKNYTSFIIKESKKGNSTEALISPDVSICDDCLKELFDKKNKRRYLHPFVNCTNCGPRYTIIKDIPYDRQSTTMSIFDMCKDCQKEYKDTLDRRFHAQANACNNCGPDVYLCDNKGKKIKVENSIKEAARLIKEGKILAIRGLGGFHLAADAKNNLSIKILRERKIREKKPFALMVDNLDTAEKFAYINKNQRKLLSSNRRPIVFLKKKKNNNISEQIAPDNQYLGVMLCYTPLHYILFFYNLEILIMTSGNKSSEPIITDNDEAFDKLKDIADFFLVHNREINLRCDDSILSFVNGKQRFVRRARAYVPLPIFLKDDSPNVLALGAELKNTACFLKKDKAFLTQHIGDMQNYDTFLAFKKSVSQMGKILDIDPNIIAYDMHPDYATTAFAKEIDKEKIAVQHHHAHLGSVMAEHNIFDDVIGIVFDGTGYGEDGKIWGGELFIANRKSFTRKKHLRYMKMPGSDMAAKEPFRMAISYLYHSFKEDFLSFNLDLFKNFDKDKIIFILDMIDKNINCPLTSSMGRFFDAVSAILGINYKISYEGQAAIELEMCVKKKHHKFYEYKDTKDTTIDTSQIIKGIVIDILNKKSKSYIAAKFHNTIVKIFTDLCIELRDKTKINKVLLSGGVFQNKYLLEAFLKRLKEAGFKSYFNILVPTNDGGISLGQAVIARANFNKD